jgi:cysteine-S-conjugate beta-lyase
MTEKPAPPLSPETILAKAGRHPELSRGYVNTPVYRGSTILFQTLEELEATDPRADYGRSWNPTAHAVEETITALEGAATTVLAPSGLSAISLALMTAVGAGDELLVTDSAYSPTRRFAEGVLKRMGVTIRYYDPRIGAGMAGLLTDKTRAIFAESPGSLTFEVQDLPAIVAAAAGRDIAVIADNSWATPLYCRPLALGADMVVHSATKMFAGHSDVFLGTVSANDKWRKRLMDTQLRLGLCASPDDCFLTARGLRTLAVRMKELSARALEMATWLESQPGVTRVIHPALPSHPDHALFRRDFVGSGSVFSIVLEPRDRESLVRMCDGLGIFGMGFSWGGFESLCLPVRPERARTATKWQEAGPLVRLHIGLEGLDDLKADLSAGLARYRAA